MSQGGKHTFECWGARRKLGEWEFKFLHRLRELPAHSYQWYLTLQKDASDEAAKCPECLAKNKVHKDK